VSHRLLDAVLTIASGPAVNFYRDESDAFGRFLTTADERRAALEAHFANVAGGDLVLIGEAAGWRGARQSGVPFTSAQLVGLQGTREASATIVHRSLNELGLGSRALLWNAFPLHPHVQGNPRSNRAPTAAELQSGRAALARAVQGRRVICVGQHATRSVSHVLGIHVRPVGEDPRARAVSVRHPSRGGAGEFRAGLKAAV